MTTIASLLTPYYAPSSMEFSSPGNKYKFELTFMGGQLNSVMNSLARGHAGWEFFNAYWRRFDGRDSGDIYSGVHPDTLISAAANLGFVDIEPLQAWVDSLQVPLTGKVSKLFSAFSSSVTLGYDQMPEIVFQDIITEINTAGFNLTSDCVFHALDDSYKIPHIHDVELILSNCPTKKMQYRAQRSDCEDFANQVKAWLGYLGYGNVALGYIEMTLLDVNNQVTGAHAVNIVLYSDTAGKIQVRFIEPQTNKLYSASEMWIGAGINGTPVRHEIYWITF